MMASFDYKNPSLLLFLMLIRAIVINNCTKKNKEHTKGILGVGVKR